jgi:hypothetical protein
MTTRRPGPADDDPLDSLLLGDAIADLPEPCPDRDLWPGVQARLAPRPRVISFTLAELAMAATLLMAVSAGVSWLAFRPARSAPPEGPVIRADAEPVNGARPDAVPADFADEQFDAAVTDLERVLREERDRLDPRTVIVIERNLRAIDDAIREARTALDQDPGNPYLNSHLADARRRKLDLLRRAAALSSGG